MITIRKAGKLIIGTVNGKPFNVPQTDDNYAALVKLQGDNAPTKDVLAFVKECRTQIIAGSNKYLAHNPQTGEYFLECDGKRSKHAIPTVLVEYIESSFDKEIDFMPILKAWANLLNNPRYNADMGKYFAKYLSTTYVDNELVEQLQKDGFEYTAAVNMATYQDLAITKEGLLATYKVVDMVTWEYVMEWDEESKEWKKVKNPKYTPIAPKLDATTGEELEKGGFEKPEFLEDFLFTPAICKNGDKFYSGTDLGYVYRVGEMQSLPTNAKRNLANTFGGGGLYIGGLNYIDTYRNDSRHVLTCFANPADILSFQSDGQAIRVDALMPNNVWDEDQAKLKQIYHSSAYGQVSEERINLIMQAAVDGDTTILDEQIRINNDRDNGSIELIEDSIDE